METINHECYVSLEVAKLLKEAGFDWEIMSFYTNDITEGCESEYELRLVKFDNWNGKNKSWCDLVSCPTLEVAQRWLRETQKYQVAVLPNGLKGYATLCFLYKEPITQPFEHYSTYEEALEIGIKKFLK